MTERTDLFKLQHGDPRSGAFHAIFEITGGMEALRTFFPDGEADEMNFALFSTSGVNGSYTTLEDIEQQYQAGAIAFEIDEPVVPVIIVQPRVCVLRYGNVPVRPEDIPWLKRLRESSWRAVQSIGKA